MKPIRTHVPLFGSAPSHVLALPLTWVVLSAVGLAAPKGKPAENVPDTYYKTPPIFLPAPMVNETKPSIIGRMGPVGLGFDLVQPNFTMKINNVEKGSPAANAGLQVGQIVESFNGQILKDRDPRFILADIIAQAEASDGKIKLKVKDKGEVVVTLPVLGSYSATWPLNCPKSDKIVRNLAEVLAKQPEPSWGSIIFLLSTGEEKDLEVVKRWVHNPKFGNAGMNWDKAWEGIELCEYYLRTGDTAVLPIIKKYADGLKTTMYRGSWNTRGGPASFSYGTLNACGVHCATFLTMAKVCGVEVDPYTFDTAFKQFYRFAGHGNVAYGDGFPEGGFRDNGKTGGLAVTMAAATLLSPQGEASNYAKARDISAMKGFYATNWFCAAHTGGGIGELWHHVAMSGMRDKYPTPYRSYFDTRRWMMDLSRRFDGSMGIGGYTSKYNGSYDVSATEKSGCFGTWMALTYTIPRKHLQLFGAPRSPHAKTDPKLPPRPWGNEADDVFLSTEPIKGGPLTMNDLLKETVEKDASLPVGGRLNQADVSDEVILRYLHHPEYGFRSAAMASIVSHHKVGMVVPLLKAGDPRLRECGLLALAGMFKGSPLAKTEVTPEMLQLTVKMIQDPKESWWVVQQALKALTVSGDPALIAEHKDRIIELSKMDCRYIHDNAITALSKICLDPQHAKTLLPLVVKGALEDKTWGFAFQTCSDLTKGLEKASPEVKAFAQPLLKQTFLELPGSYTFPGGAVLGDGPLKHRYLLAKAMTPLPGGADFMLLRPKQTVASTISKKDADAFHFNGQTKIDPKVVGVWPLAGHLEVDPKDPEGFAQKWYQGLKKPLKPSIAKYGLEFKSNGTVNALGFLGRTYSGKYNWTENMMFGVYTDDALKVKPLTIDGRDFLLVEKPFLKVDEAPAAAANSEEGESGDVAEAEPQIKPGWHPGYVLLVRDSPDFMSMGDGKKDKKKK